MKRRFLSLPIILSVLITTFLFSSQVHAHVTDEIGIMGSMAVEDSYVNNAEKKIKNLEDMHDVIVKVYVSGENLADYTSFKFSGKDLFENVYNLDEDGNPAYNVLIYYAKRGDSPYLGYFVDEEKVCGELEYFLERKIGGLIEKTGFSLPYTPEVLRINGEGDPGDLIYINAGSDHGIRKGMHGIVFKEMNIDGGTVSLTTSAFNVISVSEKECTAELSSPSPVNPPKAGQKIEIVTYIEPFDEGNAGEIISEKVDLLADFIKKCINDYGKDCTVEKSSEETEISVGKNVYLIDDSDWKDVMSLIPFTTRHYVPANVRSLLTEEQQMQERKNHARYNPTFVYHSEGEDVDLDSILNLLEQFGRTNIFFVGGVPEKINKAIEREKAGDTGVVTIWPWWEISEISTNEYPAIWKNNRTYDSIVLCEDDYKTGLMASLFASYIEAPLVFSASDMKDYEYEKVYCIGTNNSECCEEYTLEELQEYYREVTGTYKAVLVNPNDIKEENCENFEYTRDFGKLSHAYCKDSLVSPILASLKNELIVFTDIEPLSEGVKWVEPEKSRSFYVDKDENFYFLYPNGIEKTDFDEKTKTELSDRISDFPYEMVTSSNGRMYYMNNSSEVLEVESGELVAAGHKDFYDKLKEYSDKENIELIDYAIDGQENLYILYSTAEVPLALIKFGNDGNINFRRTIVSSKEEFEETIKTAVSEKHKPGIKWFTSDPLSVVLDSSLVPEKTMIKLIGSEVLFIFFLSHDKFDTLTFNRFASDKAWIDIASSVIDVKYAATLQTEEDTKPDRFYVDDGLRLYYYEEGSKRLYVDHSDNVQRTYLLSPIKNIFINKDTGRVYILSETGAIYAFMGKGNELEKFRIFNGRNDCFYYGEISFDLNQGKLNFESEVVKKSDDVKEDLKSQIDMRIYDYMTIISSPKAIPSSAYTGCEEVNYVDYRKPLDIEYSRGKAVGRIYHVTVSDTSSLINRIIMFSGNGYSYVPDSNEGGMREFGNVALLAGGFPEYQGYVTDFANQLEKHYEVSCFIEGYDTGSCESLYDSADETIPLNDPCFLTKNDIILYDGDGNVNFWDYPQIYSRDLEELRLNSPIAVASTCSGLDYYNSYEDNLFGVNFMRSGGIGYYGAVSTTLWTPFGAETVSRLMGHNSDAGGEALRGYDTGNAFISVMKDKGVTSVFKIRGREPNYILLGDPTILPALPKRLDMSYEKKVVEKDYYCYAAGGVNRCYRKGYFELYCGEDETIEGWETVKCQELPSRKGKVKAFDPLTGEEPPGILGSKSLPHMVVFSGRGGKTVEFKETEEDVSITCGDYFSYEGPALLTENGGWLAETKCAISDEDRGIGEPIGDIEVAYMEGSRLKKKTVK